MKQYIDQKLELIEMPNLYHGNPNVKIGDKYLIIGVEGSNFWLIDDDGKQTTFSIHRFKLS
jgi:hypothetical protein